MRWKTDICVVGGGPAGAVLASRLAQLDYRVLLIQRAAFPRSALGESLNPGALTLLEMIQARRMVECAGFTSTRKIHVEWGDSMTERSLEGETGLLVDRGRFDRLLLKNAQAFGVQTLQPATVSDLRQGNGGWTMSVLQSPQTVHEIEAGFLVDATGRAGLLPRKRKWTGPRTFAVHAYWRGSALPDVPRIQAGDHCWYWGVPLPDGSYNTLMFVDPEWLRAGQRVALSSRFEQALAESRLLDGCGDLSRLGPARVTDATPYLVENCVDEFSIRIGDAALALDPLSSSGVQKAMQTALSAVVVINTLRRKPGSKEAAFSFFRENLRETAERHARWAAEHYRSAGKAGTTAFWARRSAIEAAPSLELPSTRASADSLPVRVCAKTRFVDLPCIEGNFVAMKKAVLHPSLSNPIAYLGGCELVPLLRGLSGEAMSAEIALEWSAASRSSSGPALVAWLIDRGILVPQGRVVD